MQPITLILKLDAHYPVPPVGELMLHKGIAYKIIGNTDTHSSNIYGYRPEQRVIEVIDITFTAEGQLLIADEAIKQDKLRTARYLKMRAKADGTPIERVNGELVEQPQGTVLLDSFDGYGAGERLIETGMEYWYLINNGADGDDWGRNTVKTGGAGAFGWILSLNQLIGGGD